VVDKVSKWTREAYFGAINYTKMFKEGIMMNLITDSPVSLEYKQCYLCSSHGLFIGQCKDGKPDGFVRFINKFGQIYEG
jgi:hypothetical protein